MKITKYLIALTAGIGSLAIAMGEQKSTQEDSHMKQSVTYLHLLKKTPFFTRLDNAQLKWVIKHSTEWEANAGTEISNRANADDFMWILLDGGWQIEQGGTALKSGHAGPAKWYGARAVSLLPSDSKLVANQHCYVMRIRRSEFDEMVARKFDFAQHLEEGEAFYKTYLTPPQRPDHPR
jgi:hypothetical protein